MTLSTSRNLSILGIGTILGAIGAALTQFAQGGIAGVNWAVLIGGIMLGVQGILSKGAASSGGTVDGNGQPLAPPAP